jgi:hypothetical protein
MATQCQFEQELDQNVRRGPNVTAIQREQMIGMLLAGKTVKEVAHHYGQTECCIRKIHQKYHQTGTTADRPWSGRPPIFSLYQKKIIYRKACAAQKIEYSELAKEGVFVNQDGTPSKPPSCSTLYRTLKGHGLTNFPCKKRPKLNRGHVLKRLEFCKQYRNLRWGQRMLKFSDECSVQKGAGNS